MSVTVSLACESVERWLSEGAEKPVPHAIARHLADCRHCRREGAARLPLRELTGPASSEPDPLFVPGVMARVRAELPPVRRLGRKRRFMAVLAVVLLALGFTFGRELLLPGPGDPARPEPVWTQNQHVSSDAGVWTTRGVLDSIEGDDPRVLCRYIPVSGSNGEGLTF